MSQVGYDIFKEAAPQPTSNEELQERLSLYNGSKQDHVNLYMHQKFDESRKTGQFLISLIAFALTITDEELTNINWNEKDKKAKQKAICLALNKCAHADLKLGDYKSCIEHTTAAINISLTSPSLLLRARAYKFTKEYKLAMADIDLAIDITPTDEDLRKEKQLIKSAENGLSETTIHRHIPSEAPVRDLTTEQDRNNVIALGYDENAKDVRTISIGDGGERPVNIDYYPPRNNYYLNEDEELQRAIEASILSEQLRQQAESSEQVEQIEENETVPENDKRMHQQEEEGDVVVDAGMYDNDDVDD